MNASAAFLGALHAERPGLLRRCFHLTGDPDVAEDLTQEAMIIAWHKPERIPAGVTPGAWLAGIAVNLARRWHRTQWRERGRLIDVATITDDLLALDDTPIEITLEHDELATLLDRALELLPPTTRDLLLGRFIAGVPLRELAERHGLSEGAASVRIHRGKLTLRRALGNPKDHPILAASADYLPRPHADDRPEWHDWQETRIWCPFCGQHHLRGDLRPGELLQLRCPGCSVARVRFGESERTRRVLTGVSRIKPALNRAMVWADEFWTRALTEQSGACPLCARPLTIHLRYPDDSPPELDAERGIHICCTTCSNLTSDFGLSTLALWSAPGRHFWRDHPRIRLLPHREIEADGQAAIVTTFESIGDQATYSVVSAQATYRTLAVHVDPALR